MEKLTSHWFSGSYTAFLLFCTNRAQSLYLVTVFHPFYFYFTEGFTSFLQKLFAFIFVLQRKSYFGFLLLVSSVIRLEYQTRQASCVKKVSSKKKINLETISPALQNWNVLHWTFKARGFDLEIILDSGKDLLLKSWLLLIVVCKIKWWTQFQAFNFHYYTKSPLQM